MGDEYPKSLYRSGGEELIWGKAIETLAVSSHGEEMEALALGWCLHPNDCDGLRAEIIEDRPRRGRPPRMKVEVDDA